MSFNTSEFNSRVFTARETAVEVPDMADFFDGAAEWTVRGLTADELAVCNDSSDKAKNLSAVIDALSSQSPKDKAEAIKEVLGIDTNMQPDTVKRIEMLRLGSVNPECDMQTAVKLSETFPIEFFNITSEVMRLTGLGKKAGE